MSTVPIASAGAEAVITESLTNVYPVAAVLPNITWLTSPSLPSEKPLPVIVTTVPPRVVPDAGETLMTVGSGVGAVVAVVATVVAIVVGTVVAVVATVVAIVVGTVVAVVATVVAVVVGAVVAVVVTVVAVVV